MEAGLLRDVASLTWGEVAAVSGTSRSTGFSRHQTHAKLMLSNDGHAERVAMLVRGILLELHGGRAGAGDSMRSTEPQPIPRSAGDATAE
jgi:hypothetical protein